MSLPFHSTLYVYCNDIAAVQKFYTEIIGMDEVYYDAGQGALTYNSGGLYIVFMKATSLRPENDQWAKNPGYKGSGEDESPSWVITVPAAVFDTIHQRLKDADAPLLDDVQEPQPGHRQILTRDPMGMSIEIYAAPENGT